MPQLDDIVIFHPLKNRDPNVTICIITADFSYFGQLKEKIPNIEKYIIHKPIQNTRNQYYLHGINWKWLFTIIIEYDLSIDGYEFRRKEKSCYKTLYWMK